MQERWRWTSRTDPSPPAPFLVPFPMAFRPWACMAIPIHTRPATIKDAASVGKEPGSFPMPEPAIPAQAQCHYHAGHGAAGSHPHLDPQLGAPRGCPNSLHTIIQLVKCAQRKRGHQRGRGVAAWGQGCTPGNLLLQGGSLWEQSRESSGCSEPPLASHRPVAVVVPPPHPLPQARALCRGQGRDGGTSLRSSSLVIMTMRGASSCHTISQKSVTVFGMGPWVAMYSRGRPA